MVDFSILKSIDFSNTDNLLFLAVLLIIAIAIVFVAFLIAFKIIKIIKKITARIFNSGAGRKNLNQRDKGEDLEVIVSELEKSKEDRAKIPMAKIQGGDFTRNFSSDSDKGDEKDKDDIQSDKEKSAKEIAEGLSKLKSGDSGGGGASGSGMSSMNEEQDDDRGRIKIPRTKIMGGDSIKSSTPSGDDPKEENKNSAQYQKEVDVKDIAAGLSKLKSGNSATGGTIASRMPSRTGGQEGDGKGGIKMPVSSGLHGKTSVKEKGNVVAEGKKAQDGLSSKVPNTGDSNMDSVDDLLRPPVAERMSMSGQSEKDNSIFGGKEEVSRSELRQDLKSDYSYRAGRSAGLNLSPVERAKLEKEVFSQRYGRNISKTDLKSGIKQLNKKLVSAKTDQEHAKLRKEIKFFKKIGGIK